MTNNEFKQYRQKRTNEKFVQLLVNELTERGQTDVTDVIAYLVKHNIVRQSVINSFVVVKCYPTYIEQEGGKEKAVLALTNLVPLERRHVYNIIKNDYAKFRPSKLRFP